MPSLPIYGSNGSNGVIIITTNKNLKSGNKSTMKWILWYPGVSKNSMLNAYQFAGVLPKTGMIILRLDANPSGSPTHMSESAP